MTVRSLKQEFRSIRGALKVARRKEMSGQARAGLARFTLFHRVVGIFSIVAMGAFPAAQAAADDLHTIYELAIANDPQIGAAEASYMARREIVTQSRAQLLPFAQITGNTSHGRRFSPQPFVDTNPTSATFGEVIASHGPTSRFNNHGFTASVSQAIFDVTRFFQWRQARNVEAQAAAQFAAQQQELIVRVAEAYFNILEAQDRLSSSQAEREAVERQLEQVRQRFDVGLVAITDVLESTAAYDSSSVTVIEAEGAQDISFERLLRLTGRSYGTIAGLSQDFPVEHPEPRDEEAWVQAALQNNFDLKAAREAVRSAEKQVHISRAGHYPTIGAQASYNHSVSGGGDFFGSKNNSTNLSLQMTIPVFSGLSTRSRTKESAYRLEETQRNFDLTQRTTVETTRNLYSAINTDVARVRARLRAIESSQSALDATETGYEVGTRNIVDVLIAQQRLFAAQFQYASARYQYIMDTLRLKQIVGSLSPQDITDLNQFIAGGSGVNRVRPN